MGNSNTVFLQLLVVTISCLFLQVSCHGQLSLHFLRYNNHDSRCSDGTFCDSVMFFDIRESACDPKFQLMADRWSPGGSSMYNYMQPGWYSDRDVLDFGLTFAEMPNPVPFALNYNDNSGRIYITVRVLDKDTSADDLIDVFSATIEANGPDVKYLTLTSQPMMHTLTIRYWFVCNWGYHGPLCNTYCVEQDSDAGGHYTCDSNGQKVCRSGWIGAATDCKTPHPCNTGACQNGATCVPASESHTCQCAADYTGTNCEIFVNPCTTRNQCKNGATCQLDESRQPQCRCPPQFTGALCDIDVDECSASASCSNDMPCVNTHGGFYCDCTDARFRGSFCEIDLCNGTDCLNNGTCFVTAAGSAPRCRCLDGFTGATCESENACYSSPCQNGATCRNTAVGFACDCPPKFTGETCETARPDHCASGPCDNGGSCVSGTVDFNCTCPTGFRGARCELSDDATSQAPARAVNAERQVGDPSAEQAGAAGISVAGVVAGCVIAFLVLAGFGVFLGVYLLRRRRHLAESQTDDASSSGYTNEVYNNASEWSATVRTHDASTIPIDDEEVYEPISGDRGNQSPTGEQENQGPTGEQENQRPAGDQVNLAYEVDA